VLRQRDRLDLAMNGWRDQVWAAPPAGPAPAVTMPTSSERDPFAAPRRTVELDADRRRVTAGGVRNALSPAHAVG
jgi:hypothetical protein